DEASVVLLQGQGSRFVMAAHEWLSTQPRPPRPDVFNEFLPRQRADGLRYIALFRPGTPIIEAQAGEPATPVTAQTVRELRPGEPVFVGSRVRFVMGPPQRELPPPGGEPMNGWDPPDRPPPPEFSERPPPPGPPGANG